MSENTGTQQQQLQQATTESVPLYIAKARETMDDNGLYAHIAATFLLSRFPFVSHDAEDEAGAGEDAALDPDADGADSDDDSFDEAEDGNAEDADMPAPSPEEDDFYADLVQYVAYILWTARVPEAIFLGALFLLQKHSLLLKRQNKKRPVPEELHALFLTAYIVANDVLNDETYTLKDWRKIGSDMFELREMATFKREFCMVMNWKLTIREAPLKEFIDGLANEFAKKGAKESREQSVAPGQEQEDD